MLKDSHLSSYKVGGWYGLLNHTDFRPNPDYFTHLLWKRLMAGTSLPVAMTNSPEFIVRVYAHLSTTLPHVLHDWELDDQEKLHRTLDTEDLPFLTFAIINLQHNQSKTVQFDGFLADGREDFLLTAPSLSSKTMYLNGKPLTADLTTFPSLEGKRWIWTNKDGTRRKRKSQTHADSPQQHEVRGGEDVDRKKDVIELPPYSFAFVKFVRVRFQGDTFKELPYHQYYWEDTWEMLTLIGADYWVIFLPFFSFALLLLRWQVMVLAWMERHFG